MTWPGDSQALRVGIDAQPLVSQAWKHGIGRLTMGFMNALAKHDRDNEYFVLRLSGKELPVASPFEVVDVHLDRHLDTSDLGANFEYGESVAKVVSRFGIEVYHVTSPVESYTYFPVLTNCSVVTTFYDLIPIKMQYYPGYYSSCVYTGYLQKLILAKRFTTRFAAISNCTKKDMVDELGIWPSKIRVVYPALDHSFLAKGGSSVRTERPFLLYVGGGDLRKNLNFLLRAFSFIPEDLRSRYELVIDVEPEFKPKLLQQAMSLGIHEDVDFIGYPDDRTLVSYYRGCTGVVLPSLYEGFGLPLLEAMAFSKPILASKCSSIPEVVGDAALLFDPRDLKDATDKMTMLLSDTGLQAKLSRKVSERLSKFSWENSVSELKEVYNSALNDRRISTPREKIAYFSPLYPTPSGISHYSTELLKELRKRMNIDLFADNPKEASRTGQYQLRLREASEFENLWREYKTAIYQLGNSTYHSWMLRILTNHPGIVVLHDFNLHNFLLRHAVQNNDKLTYLSAMALQYGEKGLFVAEQQVKAGGPIGEYSQQYPLNAAILLFAVSVISTGKKIAQFLTRYISTPASIVPLGANIRDEVYLQTQRTKSRKLLNLSDSDLVFFIGGLIEREAYHQKQLSLCLEVFKRVLDHRRNSKLIICGITDDYVFARLSDEVSTLGLDGQVFLRRCEDFPRDFDLCAYASDVSINLRRDANASASFSTVMDLSRGIPVLASNNELYAEFPDDCVWKVDENAQEELLFEYMVQLATHPEILQAMRGNALAFIETRTWSKIAESYATLIHNLCRPAQP